MYYDNMNNTTDIVNEQNLPNVPKAKSPIKIILALLLGSVFLIGTTVIVVLALFIPAKVIVEDNNTVTGTPTVVETTVTPTPEATTAVIGTEKTFPSYKLKLGKMSVAIPAGWYVSAISSNWEMMSEEDRKTYVKSDYMTDGSFPIYRGNLLAISNGKSTIKLKLATNIIPGGWGYIMSEVPSDWTIVVKPSSTVKEGFARRKVDAVYTYAPVLSCAPVSSEDPCQKYGLNEIGIDTEMTFTGLESDLETADSFYKSTIQGKDFSMNEL